jgi:hypothetical protein
MFISGLVLNKNLQNNIDDLYNILKMNVVKTEELTFEEAIQSTELFYFDVYFSKNGTLVFLNYDLCLEPYTIIDLNILTFIISENSDSYALGYSENESNILNLKSLEGKISGKGKKNIQEKNISIEELIYQYIAKLLGKSFFDIQNDERIVRYHVSNYDWLKKVEENKTNILEPLDLKFFSDEEILDSFNKLVEYCILNNINFYLHPSLIESKNQKIVQNIIDIRKHVGFKKSFLEKLKPPFSKDGYHAYYMIGKFNKENLDVKTSLFLFNLIKDENINNTSVSNEDLNSDMALLIFAGLIIILLFAGLIYVIYSVFTLP